jgi:superfamily II RNA helicase
MCLTFYFDFGKVTFCTRPTTEFQPVPLNYIYWPAVGIHMLVKPTNDDDIRHQNQFLNTKFAAHNQHIRKTRVFSKYSAFSHKNLSLSDLWGKVEFLSSFFKLSLFYL